MTNEEFEKEMVEYAGQQVNADLTVLDVRVLLACIDTQEGIFMASNQGGSDPSGIEEMTVAEFYAWADGIRTMLGTP
jgi:hypothetical protein